MISKRKALAAIAAAGAMVLTAGAVFSVAGAADEAATATTTAPASGGQWHHHGRGGPWRIYHKLGLTSEQKAAIKTLMEGNKSQMMALHQQMQANQLKLLGVTPGDSSFSSVVSEVAASNASLATQRAAQSAALQTEIYNTVLTAAQRTQLKTLQTEWAAKITARAAAHAQ